jgi:hypothetical protein
MAGFHGRSLPRRRCFQLVLAAMLPFTGGSDLTNSHVEQFYRDVRPVSLFSASHSLICICLGPYGCPRCAHPIGDRGVSRWPACDARELGKCRSPGPSKNSEKPSDYWAWHWRDGRCKAPSQLRSPHKRTRARVQTTHLRPLHTHRNSFFHQLYGP